jgi:hypothetical protein
VNSRRRVNSTVGRKLTRMAEPKPVSRKRYAEFEGVRWNAFVELCHLTNIKELTSIQRTAHLVFLYSGELYNGGHYQYFVNKSHYDHKEVIRSLEQIGCSEHAANLAAALEEVTANPIDRPESVEDFLTGATDCDFSSYDKVFNKMHLTIDAALRNYLDKHEGDFIEWVP